ncbi:A24 family peptidase [Halioxenophilus sp. WMMB6]|uniref:prepilin peptidase n=1 Tax=Halioxenophilus sp. WMMB6 TaxID=3073815 RepID=UPI00295E2B22|nr:A24 family peptidase [Halioxenophilus sp. WMMB6]
MNEFLANPPVLISVVFLLGLIVGSFLNVVIYRLPIMMQNQWRAECCEFLQQTDDNAPAEAFNLVTPNSTCPHCQHRIKPWENIPVISYLFLRGKCANCKAPISIRYPLVETLTGLLSALLAWQYSYDWQLLALLFFTWALVSLTLIDIDHQLLPDAITLPLLWLGLLVNSQGIITDLHSAVIGAAAGYLSLWSVYWLFKLVTGKEGMGFGDFKLLAALGAWYGWQLLPLTILCSALVGAVLGTIMLRLKGKGQSTPIPFGPYLAIAGWVAMLWGNEITQWYYQVARIQ